MKKILLFILAFALCATVFVACRPSRTDDNMTYDGGTLTPDISGEVLDIQSENILRVLVNSGSEYVNGQIWVTINDDTKFVNAQGQEVHPEDVENLFAIGENASFLSTGEIMESYPMQAYAKVVFVK